jgi:hypothetical protein
MARTLLSVGRRRQTAKVPEPESRFVAKEEAKRQPAVRFSLGAEFLRYGRRPLNLLLGQPLDQDPQRGLSLGTPPGCGRLLEFKVE